MLKNLMFFMFVSVSCCAFGQTYDIVRNVCIEMFFTNGVEKGDVFNKREISYTYDADDKLVMVDYNEFDMFDGEEYRILLKKVGNCFKRSDYINGEQFLLDRYEYELNKDGMLDRKIKTFKDSEGIPNRIITEYEYNNKKKLSYVLEYQEYMEDDGMYSEYEDCYTIGFYYEDGEMMFGNGTVHNSRTELTKSFVRTPQIMEWKIGYSSFVNNTNINFYTFLDCLSVSIDSGSDDIEFATMLVNAREEYHIERIYETKYMTEWLELEYEWDENDRMIGFKVYKCNENLLDRRLFVEVGIGY